MQTDEQIRQQKAVTIDSIVEYARRAEEYRAQRDEYRLRERAVTAAMADIVKVRIGSPNDGSALVGEALSEKFQALDRPLANLIHAALDGQDEISADNADLPAIGRLVWSAVTEYLRPMAEKRADESAADPFDEDDDAYEQYEQDVLDGVRAA